MNQCLNDFWLTKDSIFEVCLEDMQSDIIEPQSIETVVFESPLM